MKLTDIERYIISITRGVGIASHTYIVGLAKTKSHAEKVIEEVGKIELADIDEEKFLIWVEHEKGGSYYRIKTQYRPVDESILSWNGNDSSSVNKLDEYDLYCEIRYEPIYEFESPTEDIKD
jgi:hypothetical protein